jgi:hypothetical protein
LEEFLIDYFADSFKLEKKNPEKWEGNKIDFFYKFIGIQLTTSNKNYTKINKLKNIRKKINS